METQNINVFSNLDGVKKNIPVSKVLKYFELRGIFFTKTMLNNYVRIGLIPPLIEKRYYTHNHLIRLYFIYTLKEKFSLEEIYFVLNKFDEEEDMVFVYKNFLDANKKLSPEIDLFIKKNIEASNPNQNIEKLIKMQSIISLCNKI